MNIYYSLIYLIGVIFLLLTCVSECEPDTHKLSIVLCIYLLIKWITDYRKCTFSYIEIWLRNVKKEDGVLFNFLEDLFDFNKCPYVYGIYLVVSIILLVNVFRYINHTYDERVKFS